MSVVVLAVAVTLAVRFDPGGPATSSSGPRLDPVVRHRLHPGHRRDRPLALVVLTAVLVPLLLIAGWHDAPNDNRLAGRARTPTALILAVEGMVLISLVALDIPAVLRVLRGDADPDVLPDRRVRRRRPVPGGGEVPAVQPVRRADHAGRGDQGVRRHRALAPCSPRAPVDFRAVVEAATTGQLQSSPAVLHALFAGFMFAFAVKAPLWPFHPLAARRRRGGDPGDRGADDGRRRQGGHVRHVALLPAVVPDSAAFFRSLIITLAVIGIVYGAVAAIGQRDVMRLIAYTSISHFGFIILGIFVMTSQGHPAPRCTWSITASRPRRCS